MFPPQRLAQFGRAPCRPGDSCPSDTRPEVTPAKRARAAGEAALIVENDSHIRQLAADVIQTLGFTVLLADEGSAALKLLAEDPVDLDVLVTGVITAGMSGLELAAQLRTRWLRLKVIYLSGVTDVVSVNGIMHPCSASLRKPFTRDELEQKITALLATP